MTGLTLLVLVSMYGYISLAQFNPSITLAFIIRDCEALPRRDWLQWSMYLVAQFVGAICGGYFAWLVGGKDACLVYTAVDSTRYAVHEAFFGELFFCMMLVSVNLHVAGDSRLKGNQIYAVAIGMILTVSVLSIGPITGSAVNAAVWVGTVASAAACVDDREQLQLQHCWIYWVAHFLAGILAALWFVLVYGGGMDKAKGKDRKGDGDNVMQPIDHKHKPGAIGHPSVRYHRASEKDVSASEDEQDGRQTKKVSVVDELLNAEVPDNAQQD